MGHLFICRGRIRKFAGRFQIARMRLSALKKTLAEFWKKNILGFATNKKEIMR